MNLVVTLSPLELCDRGEYRAAAELAGLTVGIRPERGVQGDSEHAEALLVAGIILTCTGGIQQAGDQVLAREMLTDAASLFADDPRGHIARSWLAWADYWSGNFDAALAIAGQVLAVRVEHGTHFRTLLLRVSVYSDQGLADKAWAGLGDMELLYDACDPLLKGKFHLQRGRVLRLMKECDRAIVDYDQAIEFFQQSGNLRCEAAATNNLAGIYLETEQCTQAHQHAERAQRLWRQLGDKTYEAEAWEQTALAYVGEGKHQKAREAIERALALVEHGEVLDRCLRTSCKIKQANVIESQNDCDTLTPCGTRGLPPPNPTPLKGQAVMDPLVCASLIPPELASVVLDLLIFATSPSTEPQHKAQMEAAEDALYAKTPDFERHRDEYRRSRLIRKVTDS